MLAEARFNQAMKPIARAKKTTAAKDSKPTGLEIRVLFISASWIGVDMSCPNLNVFTLADTRSYL
jgi:hypothetical protein